MGSLQLLDQACSNLENSLHVHVLCVACCAHPHGPDGSAHWTAPFSEFATSDRSPTAHDHLPVWRQRPAARQPKRSNVLKTLCQRTPRPASQTSFHLVCHHGAGPHRGDQLRCSRRRGRSTAAVIADSTRKADAHVHFTVVLHHTDGNSVSHNSRFSPRVSQ